MRHGRCANGCTGTREVTRLCDALTRSVRVSVRSSAASSRNSESLVESCISEVSSAIDFSPYQQPSSTYKGIPPTSLALSHVSNAFTMELYSPNFFADFVSKPSASFSVSVLCSIAILRARERRAGGTDSEVAASLRLARASEGSCDACLTRRLVT